MSHPTDVINSLIPLTWLKSFFWKFFIKIVTHNLWRNHLILNSFTEKTWDSTESLGKRHSSCDRIWQNFRCKSDHVFFTIIAHFRTRIFEDLFKLSYYFWKTHDHFLIENCVKSGHVTNVSFKGAFELSDETSHTEIFLEHLEKSIF